MKRSGFVKPMVTAVGILALSGVGLAQTPSESHRAASARAHEILSSASCPLPRVTKEKITEDQARDLAQQFADKNWAGFKVVRPFGHTAAAIPPCATRQSAPLRHGPLVLYSVEYSMDLKNPAGETRNLCVDQYGSVSEFCSSFGMAGGMGATGPMGPAGPTGAQGPAGSVGAQALANPETARPTSGTSCSISTSRTFDLTRRARSPTSRRTWRRIHSPRSASTAIRIRAAPIRTTKL